MNIKVLRNPTLIDGNGGEPIPHVALVIKDDIITDIIRGTSKEYPMTATVFELGDCYVIPGLIDSHVHLAGDWSLAYNRKVVDVILRHALYAGITTIRDMGGDGRALSGVAREANLDEMEAPDCYYSALVAGPPFFSGTFAKDATKGETPGKVPWMQVITPETDIHEAITLARGSGARGIKIYSDLLVPQIKKITEEAHRQDMKVWAHAAVMPTRPKHVIDTGVDAISHTDLLAMETLDALPKTWGDYIYGFSTVMRSGKIPEDTLPKALIDYICTLFDATDPRKLNLDNPCFDNIFKKMIDNDTFLDATNFLGRLFGEKMMELICGIISMAHKAGIKISAGTDKFGTPKDGPFPNLFLEIETFVDFCGFTPLEAISAATLINAEVIGITDTHGTIEVGKKANLVVLNQNPIKDIRNLRQIRFVMKNGKIYDRSFYSPEGINDIMNELW